ncbi:MAG: ferredoxin [Gemmatimonadetes bacterium]|nr:ferredoxin [Gemmatimonadota bacterium]
MSADGPDRRRFFRQLVDRTLGHAADYVGDRVEGFVGRPRHRLRPPGAIAEAAFLDTCYRCGNCVGICPARAIQHIKGESEELDGTPAIFADHQPCLVCDGLQCMPACPSGALKITPREQIAMGLARFDPEPCLRTGGEACTECVDTCPEGERALRFNDEGVVEVLNEGCIGCGVCQWRCPSQPKAIVVQLR